jgi:TonB family protein
MKKISSVFLLIILSAWTVLGQEAKVTSARANLRGAPSTNGRVLSQVLRGTNVTVLVDRSPWYLVQTDNEYVGWIHVSTISLGDRAYGSPPRDPNKYTVMGDVNFSTASEPPPPSSTSSGKPRLISGGVLNGRATTLPKPSFPPAARAVRASGAVSVQVLIDENGNVVSAAAVSGHPLLRAAAVQAAREATFSPTRLNGQPVRVSGVITYNFVP